MPPKPRKPDLTARLHQVRLKVEHAEAEAARFEAVGLERLAREKAREKRYWQFVQAVLELRPTVGSPVGRHTVH